MLAYVLNSKVKWLTKRALVWIGTISYGLYLWHNLILIIVRERVTESPWGILALGGSVSIACAALSYYFLEKPRLKLKERFAPSRPVVEHLRGEIADAPAFDELLQKSSPQLVPSDP